MQPANCVTIRDEDGDVIGTPYIGSRSVMFQKTRGPLRRLVDSYIGSWIVSRLEGLTAAEQQAVLDQIVTVADEYRY